MKHISFAFALTCLASVTFCTAADAEGFKFPAFSNPFKKPTTENSANPARPRQATGANISDTDEPTPRETSSFSFPKPKLPKFELPSFGRERTETSASHGMSRSSTTRQTSSFTTVTEQSRANHNRPSEPSGFDKFSQSTKNFFAKAKTTLMPWTADSASTSTQRRPLVPSGSGSSHSARTNGRTRTASRDHSPSGDAATGRGFTFPWSKPKPEVDDEIRSPTDFLSLDRPKY